MKSLQHFEVFQNGIKEEGMLEILTALGFNPELEVVRLNDNVVKETCKIFIEVLPNLTNLRVIDISDSILGNHHSMELFKTFTTLPGIKEIYCNYNDIEKKAAQRAIMETCLNMKSLEIVELKGNEIDPSVWKKFKAELRNNIKSFTAYSEEEEVLTSEEEDELTKGIEQMKINK